MSQILLFHGAIIGGIVGQVVAYNLGAGEPVLLWPLTIVCGVLGLIAWAYSPLPDITGGTFTSATGHGHWGLTPPEDDEVGEA